MSAQRQTSRRNPTPASSTNNNPTDRSTETRGDPTCVVCLEDRAPTRVLDACRHAYCQADLRRLVEAALEGRGTWPPRCCGERNRPDEDDVQWALESDPALYEKYLEMRWERNTPLPEKGQGEGERVDKRLKALMKEQHWRSCGRCGRVIEKTSGCDHIRFVTISFSLFCVSFLLAPPFLLPKHWPVQYARPDVLDYLYK